MLQQSGMSADVPVATPGPWIGTGLALWVCTLLMVVPVGCQCPRQCVYQWAVELGATVPLSARLETRTKESMELAGWKVVPTKPECMVKATLPRWCTGPLDPQLRRDPPVG
jgi:hypothetical protein